MEYSKKASNCKLLLLDGYYTRVEYSLSDRGKTLEPVLDAFCLWGQEHRND